MSKEAGSREDEPVCPRCGSSEFTYDSVSYYEPEKYRNEIRCTEIRLGPNGKPLRDKMGGIAKCGARWHTKGEVKTAIIAVEKAFHEQLQAKLLIITPQERVRFIYGQWHDVEEEE